MRVPQVSERIKEAPAQALRGVFAGIGQLLLYTDKLRNKARSGQDGPYARAPGEAEAATPRTAPAESVPDQPAAPQTPRTPGASGAPQTPKIPAAPKTPEPPAAATEVRDFDKTGNVRLITGDEARADDEPPAAAQPTEPAAAKDVVATAEEPEVAMAAAGEQALASAGEPAGGPSDAVPPLPNYDQLSVASLRARLRNLDVAQVRELAEYEKAHAARTDVIVMFERRVAKLEAGD